MPFLPAKLSQGSMLFAVPVFMSGQLTPDVDRDVFKLWLVVDTGCTRLSLTTRVIQLIGGLLIPDGHTHVRFAGGQEELASVYRARHIGFHADDGRWFVFSGYSLLEIPDLDLQTVDGDQIGGFLGIDFFRKRQFANVCIPNDRIGLDIQLRGVMDTGNGH